VPAFFFFLHSKPIPKKPKNMKPNTLFFFFSKNSCINHGQPAGKGREKKKKKKTPGINPGQPAGKGQGKNLKNKNPGINPG
jgi:hypothetical protein